MISFSDKVLISKLKSQQQRAFADLYNAAFASIDRYVRLNSGSTQDAEDIFQESLIIMLQKIEQPDFVLTASVKTYLFSVARNLWLKKLRNDKYLNGNQAAFLQSELDDEPTIENTNEQKLSGWLQKITVYCQKILSAIFFYDVPMERLMFKMGWKNKHTAAQQKYKCLLQVKKISRKDAL